MQLRSGTSSDHNTSRPRILIADDHVIFVEALRAYLEKTYAVVGAVADGRAMLQEAFRLKPDVVVADISMPVLNGLDAARRIRKQAPKVTFVFLTMLDDANLAAAALELGRVAFVLKSCGGAEVLKAVQETLHGRSYMTPRLSRRLGRGEGPGAPVFNGIDRTTARCRSVIRPGKFLESNCCQPQLKRKDCGISQVPYHASVQSQEQRRLGPVCAEAWSDLSQSRIVSLRLNSSRDRRAHPRQG